MPRYTIEKQSASYIPVKIATITTMIVPKINPASFIAYGCQWTPKLCQAYKPKVHAKGQMHDAWINTNIGGNANRTKPMMPAPMQMLQRFAYAPSNDVFFSRSCTRISFGSPPTAFFATMEEYCAPSDDFSFDMRGLEGRKKGDFGIGGGELPFPDTAAAVVEFMFNQWCVLVLVPSSIYVLSPLSLQ